LRPEGRAWRRIRKGAAAALALFLLAGGSQAAAGAEPVVRAVLFFLPTCGHCEYVINDVLPGLFEEAGGAPDLYYDETLDPGRVAFHLMDNGRLEMLLVDASVYEGSNLFYAATDAFDIPSGGVPRLIVGDRCLIGSVDIPEQFPGIVLGALGSGESIDWPEIPGLAQATIDFFATSASFAAATAAATSAPPATSGNRIAKTTR